MTKKHYKANPAAISRYLVSKGFNKSESRPSRVRGWANLSRGFTVLFHNEGVVVVFRTGLFSGAAEDCEKALRKFLPALEERFGADRVVFKAPWKSEPSPATSTKKANTKKP